MSPRFARLVTQLEDKLSAWRELSERLKEAMDSSVPELFRTSTVGKILHDFYTGLEDMFRTVAEETEEGLPQTDQWHRELLHIMTLEVPGVRPPVIPSELEDELLPYLRFRHLFRNVYGRLDWGRMEGLALRMPDVMGRASKSLESFLSYLRSLAEI